MSPTIRGLGGKARRSHGEGDAVRVGSVAVTVLRSVAVQWWRRGDNEDSSGASRRWLRPSLDRLGLSLGVAAHGQPRTENRRPPPLFIAQCDGGPPTM